MRQPSRRRSLKTSSWTLLRYVAGVTERVAPNIVSYRDENGRFRSRKQLNKVPGIGAKTHEQAAGFLRIRGGENPLDGTAVHPESYPVVEQIARSLDTPVAELIANPQLLTKVDARQIDAGAFTVKDIPEELRKPGRDPREPEQVLDVILRCHHRVLELAPRALTNITLDDRKGAFGRLRGKVQDVEQILGKPLFRP